MNKKIEFQLNLPAYIAFILATVLVISLVSLGLFWQSPTRKLAIEIQQATQDDLDSVFIFASTKDQVDLEDNILTTADLHHIEEQIDNLILELNTEINFDLHNSDKIIPLLDL